MPGWYSWLVVVLLNLTTSSAALVISVHVIHDQQTAQTKQREQGREMTCTLIVAQDNAFAESAPVTRAGRKAAAAWHSLREQLGCDHD